MSNSNCNDNLSDVCNVVWRSAGRQGPPGVLPSEIPAEVVKFSFEGTACFPSSTTDLTSALLNIESFLSHLDCSYGNGSPFQVLYMHPTTGKWIPGDIVDILGETLPHLLCFDENICSMPEKWILSKRGNEIQGRSLVDLIQELLPQLLCFDSDICSADNKQVLSMNGTHFQATDISSLITIPGSVELPAFLDCFDPDICSADNKQVLAMNGTHFEATDISSLITIPDPEELPDFLNCIDDNICSAATGQALIFNGSQFTNQTLPSFPAWADCIDENICSAPDGSFLIKIGEDYTAQRFTDLFAANLPNQLKCFGSGICGASAGQALISNGNQWINADLPTFDYSDLNLASNPDNSPKNATWVSDGNSWREVVQDGFVANMDPNMVQTINAGGSASDVVDQNVGFFQETNDLSNSFNPALGRFTNNTGSTQVYMIEASGEPIVVSGVLNGKAQLRIQTSSNNNALYIGSFVTPDGVGLTGENISINDQGMTSSGAGSIVLNPGESFWMNMRVSSTTAVSVALPGRTVNFSARKLNAFN